MNLLASVSIVLLVVYVNLGYSVPGLDFSDQYIGIAEIVLFLVIALVSLVLGIILVLGSARMVDLQSYPIAVFAAVASVLPLAVGFPFGLPFGIWALLVLSRQDVKAAFAGESALQQKKKSGSDSAMGGMIPIGLAVGVTLGAATDNIAVFTSLGAIFGIIAGSLIDTKRRQKSKD